MMKSKLLLLSLLIPLLAGCPGNNNHGGDKPSGGDGPSDPGEDPVDPGEDPEEEEFNLTVYFFLDFSHSEVFEDEDGNLLPRDKYPTNAIYKMEWYALKPLGEMPEGAAITDSMAADPQYPHFIGYSRYSSCLDEDLLWNWEKDYEATNTLNLYGIWVSQ